MKLIEIITKKLDHINEKYSKINLIKTSNDPQVLQKDIDLISNYIEMLNDNFESVINIPLEELESLINKYPSFSLEKDDLKILEDIYFVLNGKINLKLPIDLSDNDKTFLKSFFTKFVLLQNSLTERLDQYQKVSTQDENLEIEIISYEDLLEKIQDPDNIEPIYEDEFRLIENIVKDSKFKFSQKRDLLLSVMEYNSQIAKNLKKTPKLNVEELIDVLQIDYNLDDSYIKVVQKYRNDVALYGNMDNIKDILEFLKSKNLLFRFPAVELITILIFATKSSVVSTYKYLEENNMLENAFFYTASVWKYNHEKKLSAMRSRKDESNGDFKNGSLKELANKISLDEMIACYNFLKQKGYDINLSDEKAVAVLSCGLKRLQHNYEQYVLYGLIDDKKNPKEKHSILTFSNIMDRIDLLIELGLYEYALKYPSAVQSLKSGSVATLFDLKNRCSDADYKERIFVPNSGFLKGDIGMRNPQNSLSDEDIYQYLLDSGLYEYDIPDMKKINDYLYKNNPMDIKQEIFEDPNIINLEENYKENDYSYNFNGQLISRIKVLRNYSALKGTNEFNPNSILICSILNNSMVTKDRFMDIVNSVGYKMSTGRN